MANTQSAKKAMRGSERKRIRNRMVKSTVRTYLKRARLALEGDDVEAASAATKIAVSELDRAVSKGVMHRNTVSRTKSRLMKRLATLESGEGKS